MPTARKPIHALRWWICGLLFASTVINYVDRQTFSLLAPYLKLQYHWTNTDYAAIAIGFRVAYSIGQTVLGRVMDRLGTRRGLTFSIESTVSSTAGGYTATSRVPSGCISKVAWTGTNDSTAQNPGLKIRLFDLAWTNPHAEKEIVSLDVLSADKGSDPFLVAVTVQRDR